MYENVTRVGRNVSFCAPLARVSERNRERPLLPGDPNREYLVARQRASGFLDA